MRDKRHFRVLKRFSCFKKGIRLDLTLQETYRLRGSASTTFLIQITICQLKRRFVFRLPLADLLQTIFRQLNGSDERLRFVDALLIFVRRDGIRHQPAARLQVGNIPIRHHRSQSDRHVHIA